ncbi:MAG: histidinol dehydrogenase [Actinobacteria bacterium]|nr:histidinol dehydrogenase [Actinomycetota bacterium]
MLKDFLKVSKIKDLGQVREFAARSSSIKPQIIKTVSGIIEDIRLSGQQALFKYCSKYDGIKAKKLEDIKVCKEEFEKASDSIPLKYPGLVDAIKTAVKNLELYHSFQIKNEPKTWYFKTGKENKKILGQIVRPLERAGLYIPGGRFLYPSSILMSAVPAKIAGVKDIAVCTPPGRDGQISGLLLYIFSMLGIYEVYKIGGAQAIAVLAYGTEDIKKVDKIAGPGNIYVTAAKKLVYGSVGIDSLAGPSEVMVIADKSANPAYIASDLISQAEHDPQSSCLLLSTDEGIAENTIKEICRQVDFISENYKDRFDRETVVKTLKKRCRIFFSQSMGLCIDACNLFAPEHLELMVNDYESILQQIKNAGAIFIGNYSPVAAGDYLCGTNHVIPTAQNARFSSPLGVYDFMKKSSVANYDRQSLESEAGHISVFSDFENLVAHKNSIEIRFKT